MSIVFVVSARHDPCRIGVNRPINTVPLYSRVERLTDLQRRKRAHQRSVCRAIRRQTTDFARSGTEPAAGPHAGYGSILTSHFGPDSGTRFGGYDITALIGEGGMGQVYRATDTRLKRQVAIKVLPPSLAADAGRIARFQREAEALASLNHPNVAGIYGLEDSGGITALVMELVEGDDLSQRIARGAIPVEEAIADSETDRRGTRGGARGASSIAISNPRTLRSVTTAR